MWTQHQKLNNIVTLTRNSDGHTWKQKCKIQMQILTKNGSLIEFMYMPLELKMFPMGLELDCCLPQLFHVNLACRLFPAYFYYLIWTTATQWIFEFFFINTSVD